jgi:hypothetical protein
MFSRMTRIDIKTVAAAIGLAAVISTPAAAVNWAHGSGQSCDAACRKIGRNAVSSSVHKNTRNAFYVCVGDHPDGQRPGYNLKPHWAKGCWVGLGGKEVSLPNYSCLCD